MKLGYQNFARQLTMRYAAALTNGYYGDAQRYEKRLNACHMTLEVVKLAPTNYETIYTDTVYCVDFEGHVVSTCRVYGNGRV